MSVMEHNELQLGHNDSEGTSITEESSDLACFQGTLREAEYAVLYAPPPPRPPRFACLPMGITRKEVDIIKLTAQFVCVYGFYFGLELEKTVFMKPELETHFVFLKKSFYDTRHIFYGQLRYGYSKVLLRSQKMWKKGTSTAAMLVDGFLSILYQVLLGKEEHEQGVEGAMIDLHAFQFFVNMEYNDCDQPPMVTHDIKPYVYDPTRIMTMMLRPQTHDAEPISFPLLPDQGITRKELYIIKLTAQFVSVFGMCFGQDLMKSVFMKPELEPLFRFMLSTDTRHGFYSQLTIGYTRVLLCIEKLMEKGDSTETVLEAFFDLLGKVLEREEEGLEMATLDLQAFEFFVKVEYTDWRQRIPGYLSILKNPPPQMQSPLGSQLSHTDQVHRPHSMRMIRPAPPRRGISRLISSSIPRNSLLVTKRPKSTK